MNRTIPLSSASTPGQLDYASVLPYQEDASSFNNVSDNTNTVSNERGVDVDIFHQFFVNVGNLNSIALMKDFVLGERDEATFEQAKNAGYMQKVATKMKLVNGCNEVDVTYYQNYRTSLV